MSQNSNYMSQYYAAKEKRKKKNKNSNVASVNQSENTVSSNEVANDDFMSQYYAAKAKRKEEAARKRINQEVLNFIITPEDGLLPNPVTRPFSTVGTLTSNKDEEDIAPVKDKEDDSKLDFFQKGAFEDGYRFGDVTKVILGTGGDAGLSIVKGIGRLGEGLGDLVTYGVAGVADLIGQDEYAEKVKKRAQDNFVDYLFDDATDYVDQYSVLGRTSDAILEGVGQVGGIIATGGLGASAGLTTAGVTALTTGTMGLSGMGSGMSEAYQAGATDGEAVAYGAISGAADALSELIFGGLGKAVNAVGLSKGLSSADDILAKKVSGLFSKQLAKNIAEYGIKAGAEGFEEVIAGTAQAIGKKLTYMSEEELGKIVADENLLEQFVVGAVTSGIAQAPSLHVANKTGTDFITGYNQNEQAVIKKEVENRIAEKEKNGTKLTAKEKSAIEAQVERDLEKGYISTETIESVLGDSTAYDSLLKESEEFNTLYETATGELSKKQQDRLAELEAKNKENPYKDALKTAKSQYSQSVRDRVNGSRLVESYNERTRRTQAFEADLTKYDAKQQAVIKKAVDSGILNNTNRTHEFVDMVAKISADKGILFDFTNNAKLKESGFALDGKSVNGYVTKDGITLNMDSAKAWQSTVGHEITHVLEGTEFYNALQKTLFDYAKSKNDFQGRYETLTKLYENIKGADINAELTADLVGDYLFTDANFIKNLSANHRNVFQKIYDEIKYLMKVATAGSKEARELEKVKKAFEDAYRADGKTEISAAEVEVADTQYSVSVTDKETIDFLENQEHITTYKAMQVIDGKLYPPMAAKVKDENGKYQLSNPSQIGVWQQATEDPKNIKKFKDGVGYYTLNKGNGKSLDAAYNPYEHSSNLVLNDQFEEAYNRPNIVTVECVIPASEMTSGYKAEYAKDGTGLLDWKSGTVAGKLKNNQRKVYLSRWLKPVRILSDAETASMYKDIVGDVAVPFNVVPPGLLTELEKAGVNIDYEGSPNYKSHQRRKAEKASADAKYSLSEEQQEYFKDSVVRDENGNLKVMYHGTSRGGHTVFDTYGSNYGLFGTGSYFTDNKDIAQSYTKKGKGNNPQVYESYLNIKNPIDMDAQADPAEWAKAFEEVDFPKSGTNEQFYRAVEEFYADQYMSKWEVAEIIQESLQFGMGYDGITHIGGGRVNPEGVRHQVYIAFDPEQIKNIDNISPTDDPDIRYSLTENRVGDQKIINKLTKEEIDRNTYMVLDRLNNGDVVSADELANLKEVREGKLKMDELVQDFITKHPDFRDIPIEDVGTYLLNDNERIQLRWQIIDTRMEEGSFSGLDEKGKEVYNGSVKNDKRLDIVIGLPASGKSSSIVNPLSQFYQSAVIDSDMIKTMLPEFNDGWGASLVHEESSIINSQLLEKTMSSGKNVVLPIVGAKVKSVENYIDIAKKLGYDVNLHLNELPSGKALSRMLKRYFDEGRFINPSATVENGDKPTEVYEQLKQRGDISGYSRWNNDVPKGQRPTQSEISENNQVYGQYSSTWRASRGQVSGRLVAPTEQAGWTDNEIAPIYQKPFGVSDGQNLQYSLTRGGEYVRTNEFRNLQAESQRMSDEEWNFYLRGGENEVVRRRVSAVLQRQMDTFRRSGGSHNGVLRLSGKGNQFNIYEGVDPSLFHDVFELSRKYLKNGELVDLHGIETTEDHGIGYKYCENYLSEDGLSGFSITPDGDLISVFNASEKGGFLRAISEVVKAKAKTLDCYASPNQNLMEMYEKVFGFKTASVMDYNMKYDHDNIAENHSKPKVAFMVNTENDIETRAFTKDQYDEAVEYRNSFVSQATSNEVAFSMPKIADSGISKSLSNTDEQHPVYGNYSVPLKDLRLEIAPVQEEVAPVAENAPATEIATQEATQDLFPNDLAPAESELSSLIEERTALEETLLEMVENGNVGEEFNRLSAQWDAINQRAIALENELLESESGRIDSLTDSDVPPEMDAPYAGEASNQSVPDPFADRDMFDVGNKKVKAYMYENPEVKPFFQDAALGMLDDLHNGTKGEKWFNDDVYYESGGEKGWGGTKRTTTPDIADLLDNWHYTYDQIDKGLNAIIEDNGKENNAVSKRIEFMLDYRLRNGYTGVWGEQFPPDQGYINLLKEKQINEYSEEAFNRFMENADQYAPIAPVAEEAPVAPVTSEAPVKEQYEAVTPKRAKEPKMIRVDTAKAEQVARVLVDEPATNKKKTGLWSLVKEYVLDNGMVFEDLSKKTKNRNIEAKWNFVRYARGMAQHLMESGADGVKSLKSIMDEANATGKTEAFFEYLYHMHNVDRMSLEGRYEGVPNKAVFGDSVTAEMSRAFASDLAKENPEFRRMAQDVYRYNAHLRQLLVDGGVISQETADLWAEMYPHYVPIRRAGHSDLSINVPLDTKKTGVNAPIKRATGGSDDILNLFDTMGQRTIQTLTAVAKNRFGVELKNALGSTVDSTQASVDEVIDSIDTHEELLQAGKNGMSPTFTVFENGEKVTFEITEEMYQAMRPTSELLSHTIKPLNVASNIHRGVLTEYNPVFMITNAIKDAQDVLINSQHPLKTYAKFPKAVKELTGKGKWYNEYMENGGEHNSYFDTDTNTFQEENKVLEGIKKWTGLGAISNANNFIERVPRLAEYIASREAGRSIEESMLDAARVTTNFAAGGKLTKALNRNGFTFLNASMQGAVQQVRNIREAKMNGLRGTLTLAAKFAVAGLVPALLNGLLWEDDEEYEELSDYVKDNYYIVAKYGDGQFVRIPKGRTTAVIQSAFDQMGNLITGNDEVDLKRFGELLVSNLAPNNPLDNNIIAPIKQALTNTTWYGDDLVPTRLQDLPAAEQYDETTDSISRWLGEKAGEIGIDISPVKINYLLDQYTGGVGDTILPMLTPAAESGDNTFVGNLLAPFKDKFTTDSVLKNQNVSDFYEKVDELAVNAKKSGATDEDILMSKYMNSAAASVGQLYGDKRKEQNTNLPDDQKYQMVRGVQQDIVDAVKNALGSYEDVTINGNYATVGDMYFQKKDGEWQKMSKDQVSKYNATSKAGDAPYATDGHNHYRYYTPEGETEAEWRKLTDEQVEKQNKVTSGLGITPEEYWGNKEEYDYAYENPENYAVAKAVGGYESYRTYSSELYDIKADKDKNGKSISGSRKNKVIDYINSLDIDYGMKLVLLKSEYNAEDDYNREIIEYINGRNDLSYEEKVTIYKKIGFNVDSNGYITW